MKIPKLTVLTFVENACIHGIEGGLNDGVVEVRFQKQHDQLHIIIQDTGVGMEQDKLNLIRTMLLDPSLERLSELSSIGVMNAYIRLRMYFDERVQVSIDSERYKGTTIRIQIPLVPASQDKGSEDMINVLIVDDEPFIRQGLILLIDWNSLGFQVCGQASNGVQALECIRTMRPDLVISDIKMPEMDGMQLAKIIYEQYGGEMKMVLLSGFYEFEYAKQAIKYQVNDYILKPIVKDELLQVLEAFRKEFIENRGKAASGKAGTARYGTAGSINFTWNGR